GQDAKLKNCRSRHVRKYVTIKNMVYGCAFFFSLSFLFGNDDSLSGTGGEMMIRLY
uniref:Uncharacterized protein n=1 Tax=Oryza brachyantha TaxID=4533 RepID=J3KY86_ORYBR